jgi:hypothetical protein
VHTGFGWGNLKERNHLEDVGLDGKVTFELIFKKQDAEHGLD